MNLCGGSIVVTRSLFQERDEGATPISPHHFVVEGITFEEAEACYEKWHYLGKTDFLATVNYGAKTPGHLWGALSFGAPNAKILDGYWTADTQQGWWEIKRLALSDDLPKNSESRFIALCIRFLRKAYFVKGIVSYADSGVGHTGTIYKASGFTYCGLTAPKNDFWAEETGKIVQRGEVKHLGGEWKPRTQKHLFIKTFD